MVSVFVNNNKNNFCEASFALFVLLALHLLIYFIILYRCIEKKGLPLINFKKTNNVFRPFLIATTITIASTLVIKLSFKVGLFHYKPQKLGPLVCTLMWIPCTPTRTLKIFLKYKERKLIYAFSVFIIIIYKKELLFT